MMESDWIGGRLLYTDWQGVPQEVTFELSPPHWRKSAMHRSIG